MEHGYPTTADEIDGPWLTDALAERHPGAVVESVEILDRHELTNAHARIAVRYVDEAQAAAAGAPTTAFCKLAPTDDRREAIIATGMGQREALFYASLASEVDMRVPAVHVARQDDESGLFVLVLEDLVESGAQVSDGTWGIPPDGVAGALEDLAALHARFFDPAVRAAVAPWVPVLGPGGDYGKIMLRYGLENHRDRLTDAFVAVAGIYTDHTPALQALWQDGEPTVIHGDPHLGNLFLDEGRVGFLDWGIVNVGSPLRDVSYLLTMGMDPADRRAHEVDLLRLYIAALAGLGGPTLTFDDVWEAHRLQAAYTVPASCQVVTFPADMTEGRRVFSDAFLEKCLAALDDLDVVAALADRGLHDVSAAAGS